MIKVMVVEDQVMLREALITLINDQQDMEVVAGIGSAGDALEACETQRPDLILMDALTEPAIAPGADPMPTGISATALIRKKFPKVKVVIMTGLPELTFIGAARMAGAHSFVYKSAGKDRLLDVIRMAMREGYVWPESPPLRMPFDVDFSRREIQVLRLFCQGKTRPEVATELGISEATVKALITALLNKTGFDSIMRLAVYAVSNGYIAPQV